MIYIGIGSNLGDRKKIIEIALSEIENSVGNIVDTSNIYETAPWGFECDTNFLNMAICIESSFSADVILAKLQEIETSLGRIRDKAKKGYSSRPIDLDILFIDNKIIDTDFLKVPHPLIEQRLFVLKPLNDICPNFIHPKLLKTIHELLLDLEH